MHTPALLVATKSLTGMLHKSTCNTQASPQVTTSQQHALSDTECTQISAQTTLQARAHTHRSVKAACCWQSIHLLPPTPTVPNFHTT